MAFFIMEYRKKGYTLAMAMHPKPGTGKRIFSVSGSDLGTEDIEHVRELAAHPDNTPDGYELFSVRDRDAMAQQEAGE